MNTRIDDLFGWREPRDPSLGAMLIDTLPDPERWLDAPNMIFDGRSPIDLVGTDEEEMIVNLLRAVKNMESQS